MGGMNRMQFFKGELKLGDLYYRDKEVVCQSARKLNSEYWSRKLFWGLHVVVSRVTLGMVTFLVMSETQDVDNEEIDSICREYATDLAKQSDVSKVDCYKDKILVSEITLYTFFDLLKEEWLEKMYEDKDEIYDLLHISGSKYVCKEELIASTIKERKSTRSYIPKDELVRIRNSRIQQGIVAYSPVHYIVVESNDTIAEQIEDEIIYELRKAGRITSRRLIKLTDSEMINLERHRYKIQNLNNLDGGTVIVSMNHCDFEDAVKLTKAVYSEENHYLSKYEVIFHVSENDQKLLNAIEDTCKLWPFIHIRNKRLNKKTAIKQLEEIATANNVIVTQEDCLKVLKDQKNYSFDEVNEMFRKWFLTDYTISKYHPQYRKKIEEYYGEKEKDTDALKELENLVGLRDVKELCVKIIKFYELQALRRNELSDSEGIGMHMIFTGNPGTAKTTVARLMAKIFKQKGILSKGELIEVGRQDLVGKYVGWTAKIVKEYFDRAKGSVLFIDEAYSLLDGDKNSFGTEAVNTIVQEMENRRDDVVVIFAGYKKEMNEFVSANSGLKSRISFFVDFPDYSGAELYEILNIFAKKNHFELNSDVHDAFMKTIEMQDTVNGNGRLVRNEFEKARLRQANRLLQTSKKPKREDLFKLVGADFGGAS